MFLLTIATMKTLGASCSLVGPGKNPSAFCARPKKASNGYIVGNGDCQKQDLHLDLVVDKTDCEFLDIEKVDVRRVEGIADNEDFKFSAKGGRRQLSLSFSEGLAAYIDRVNAPILS